jgi:hypothetical protein
MTNAQQRSRDINRRIERSDHWLRTLASLTALVLIVLGALTYIQIINVNGRLEAQIKDHRRDTDRTIKRIEQENKRTHQQEIFFQRCFLLLQSGQRDEAAIDRCIQEAEAKYSDKSIQSNSTAPTPSPTVTNATQSTAPPKQPEQPAPSEPTATAPPPEGVARVLESLRAFGKKVLK